MDFPNPSPVVHGGGGDVEFLFGAFIALTYLHPSSSSSSSWTPPASPGDWWPLSSGRRGSRSPHDLPETRGGKISRVDKNNNNMTLLCFVVAEADTHLVFLWVHLMSSWGEVQCGETGKAKVEEIHKYLHPEFTSTKPQK